MAARVEVRVALPPLTEFPPLEEEAVLEGALVP